MLEADVYNFLQRVKPLDVDSTGSLVSDIL